jgi:uncharacterized phage protein (TIGR02220 family)
MQTAAQRRMEMYMKKIEWVKLDTGFFEDEKIVLLLSEYGEKIILFFLRLLTLAGKQNQGGQISLSENIPYSVNDVAKICNLTPKKCQNFLEILEDFGIILIEICQNFDENAQYKNKNEVESHQKHEVISQYKNKNKMIFIKNWEKHQSTGKLDKIRQQQAERAKRYRENQNKSNVPVTLRHATEVRSKKEEVRSKNKEIKESVTIDKNCNVTDDRCSTFSDLEIPQKSEIPETPKLEEEPADKPSLDGKKEKAGEGRKAQEKPSKKAQEKEKQKAIAQDVLKFLNETTGRNFRFTQSFQSSVFGRLNEGHTAEEFRTVIQKKTAEWKGTEYEKFLNPDTLFRPSKFDKYLNQPWPKEVRQPPKGGISSWDPIPDDVLEEEYS